MRTIVAVTAALSILFVGVWAISEEAQRAESAVTTGVESDTYNVSVSVMEGVTHGGGEAMIWFGVAAIVLVALGLLVAAAGGGR